MSVPEYKAFSERNETGCKLLQSIYEEFSDNKDYYLEDILNYINTNNFNMCNKEYPALMGNKDDMKYIAKTLKYLGYTVTVTRYFGGTHMYYPYVILAGKDGKYASIYCRGCDYHFFLGLNELWENNKRMKGMEYVNEM